MNFRRLASYSKNRLIVTTYPTGSDKSFVFVYGNGNGLACLGVLISNADRPAYLVGFSNAVFNGKSGSDPNWSYKWTLTVPKYSSLLLISESPVDIAWDEA